ncbi:hypothetical protein [Actinosynnema mirum]|uniref:hypothetical protein n=1 Tax=Actinosynnema mirum TaxID=40567 RepID=UPI00019AAE18
MVLDDKLFRTDRYHGETTLNRHKRVIDAWYSGRARRHALPALAGAATELGLPTLADQGYLNAGHGVITPNRTPRKRWAEPELTVDQKTHDLLPRGLRGRGERGFALQVGRWKALRHTTASPRKPTRIVAAALACTHYEHHWRSTAQTPR